MFIVKICKQYINKFENIINITQIPIKIQVLLTIQYKSFQNIL